MKRFLAVGLLISGAFAQTTLLAEQKMPTGGDPDDRISDQVRMKLATDQDVKGGALDVTVKDGVVTIKGRVDSDKGKTKATHLAKKVKGVKDVDNELQVGPPTA
jgi:osmotically-inducible protein OsmY